MISEIFVQNFKSIEKMKLGLGRVNVLIGENGSGKSNILEAIALMGAAEVDKLDNEFLVSRGIRVTESPLMVSAFPDKVCAPGEKEDRVKLAATARDGKMFSLELSPLKSGWNAQFGEKFSKHSVSISKQKEKGNNENELPIIDSPEALLKLAKPSVKATDDGILISFEPIKAANDVSDEVVSKFVEMVTERFNASFLKLNRSLAEKHIQCGRFLIYAPENTALRRFEDEGQIQPVGIRGEGLFKMLQGFAQHENVERLTELKRSLELVGWFFDFNISPSLAPGENRLRIYDRFLGADVPFDQRSANEGFLFLIFYFSVFVSNDTPPFFAIDNIDAALNPKLCAELMRRLCALAKKWEKQVILTTHNPAILDGLNLSDDEQRLYSVYRNEEGRTQVRRISAPKPRVGEVPVKLSDAFLQGLIGGLPKNF